MFPDTDEPSSGAGADRSAVVLTTSWCEGSGTVNLADAVSVDPLDKTSWAVMSWAPGASVPKSKALAVVVEPPWKSQGALLSVVTRTPSRWKRTRLRPVSGPTNTNAGSLTVAPSRVTGAERSDWSDTNSW